MSHSYVDVGDASGCSGVEGGSSQDRTRDERVAFVDAQGTGSSLQATVLHYPEEEVQFEEGRSGGPGEEASAPDSAADEASQTQAVWAAAVWRTWWERKGPATSLTLPTSPYFVWWL
ncbi:hypothetical protein ACA910_007378 [Epithemia clementina (nom. ined.)]